jgi:hypothetical protein
VNVDDSGMNAKGSLMRLLIVRRGDLGLYRRFRAQFATDPTVKVVTDRRSAERRRDGLGHEPDRRRGDRRRDERYVSLALRSAGWVELDNQIPE